MRAADGIHFTKAGSRKLAQFLEADIKRAFDAAKPQGDIANLPPDIEQAAIDINAQIRREMGVARPGRRAGVGRAGKAAGRPDSVADRQGRCRRAARWSTRQTRRGEGGALERMLAQGAPIEPKPGRADDFSWPRL